MLDSLLTLLDDLCMTVVGALKGCLDVYAELFYGVTGAIGKFGKGAVVAGGVIAGGYIATSGAQQPAGPLLGQPPAASADALKPETGSDWTDRVTAGLPGAPAAPAATEPVTPAPANEGAIQTAKLI